MGAAARARAQARAALAALAILAAPAAAHAQPELVVNGGFETGDLTGFVLRGSPSNGVDDCCVRTGAFSAFLG